MLREMGVRLWGPAAEEPVAELRPAAEAPPGSDATQPGRSAEAVRAGAETMPGGAKAQDRATADEAAQQRPARRGNAEPAPAEGWADTAVRRSGTSGRPASSVSPPGVEPQPATRPSRPATAVPPGSPVPASSAATGLDVHSILTPGADERADAIARMDWAQLQQAVAGCRACGLCDSRRQTVFGTGHPQAHWMIVGEAPGEQEDLQGEPFVGAAGQLLDRMLAALALTRADDGSRPPSQCVFIANTLKCRPPRNRNPSPEEMQRCEPFLRRQLELVRPRLILAMGRFAVQALLRTDAPIGRLRGRVHHVEGVPLVVTYHPAYLLRNLPDKARAWEDLCLAASVAEQPSER